MADLQKKVFKDVSLEDLFAEIHENSSKTRKQVKSLIEDLKILIGDVEDAALIVPLIKEYLEISVKNDEHLVKLATVIQRIESGSGKGSEFNLEDLMESITNDIVQTEKHIEKVSEKLPS